MKDPIKSGNEMSYNKVEFSMKCTETHGGLKIVSLHFEALVADKGGDIKGKYGHTGPIVISSHRSLEDFVRQVTHLKEKSVKFTLNEKDISEMSTTGAIYHILVEAIRLLPEQFEFLVDLTKTCGTCRENGKICVSESFINNIVAKIYPERAFPIISKRHKPSTAETEAEEISMIDEAVTTGEPDAEMVVANLSYEATARTEATA